MHKPKSEKLLDQALKVTPKEAAEAERLLEALRAEDLKPTKEAMELAHVALSLDHALQLADAGAWTPSVAELATVKEAHKQVWAKFNSLDCVKEGAAILDRPLN